MSATPVPAGTLDRGAARTCAPTAAAAGHPVGGPPATSGAATGGRDRLAPVTRPTDLPEHAAGTSPEPAAAPGPQAGGLRPRRVVPRTLPEVLGPVAPVPAELEGLTVTGVSTDARTTRPGDVFVALPGARTHGARHARAAVDAGALVVVTDSEGAALLAAAPDPLTVPVLVVADPRGVVGPLAARAYGEPHTGMTTYGVTGTNGKTTTTYVLDAVLRALGHRTGMVGTIEIRSGERAVPSVLTTPEAADLVALLAVMREDGVDALAMEVSSHALALHRVDGLVYDVAGFTNLSQDHLDFHGDLDSYLAAKAELFTTRRARRGVVVVPASGPARAWALRLLELAEVPVEQVLLPGAQPAPGTAPQTGWAVTDVRATPEGQSFSLRPRGGDGELRVTTTLPGDFNVANVALALAQVLAAGTGLEALQRALDSVGGVHPQVPGRMEVVAGPAGGPRVVVDFAHNPDALALALEALRPTTPGRLVVVFGATGERDAVKRPIMGRVAVERADVVVVTDDDPHSEEPGVMRRAVLEGARSALAASSPARDVTVLEVSPRAEAIRAAILDAGERDTVLVAGRGHEVWQEIDGVNHPLDDRAEARAALARWAAAPTREQD